MTKNPNNRDPYVFQPIILDQETHEKRNMIQMLPTVHRTETMDKFFGATVNNLFDPGKGKPINGYIGQKPLWYDPEQDYYLEESTTDRSFYQLEASMVSRNTDGDLTDVLTYPDLINQLRFQGALTNNHNRLFSQDFYTWCPPVDLDKIVNFRQYVWLPVSEVRNHFIEVTGPSYQVTVSDLSTKYFLPGYGSTDSELATFYDLSVLNDQLIFAQVDGINQSFTYVSGDDFITFPQPLPVDGVLKIWVYSDVENNALNLQTPNIKAFGGIQLSSGMRIRLVKDITTDYKNDIVYIVEGVGSKVFFIQERERHDYINTAGWDTVAWEPITDQYNDGEETVYNLSTLSAVYRNAATLTPSTFYNDQVVETLTERDALVDQGEVLPDRPGTIVTVTDINKKFMWTGETWVRFLSHGWDADFMEVSPFDLKPDYLIMERGCANQNEWSENNRWFHVDTLPSTLSSDYIASRRATRPIIEFTRNLELYGYGTTRRLPVDILVENIDNPQLYISQNPTLIELDGIEVSTVGSKIKVDATNPATGLPYGEVDSIRVLFRNTINSLVNDNVFVLVNQNGSLTLILETDGNNPSGTPEFNEVLKVRLGSYSSKNLFWNGSAWVASQVKLGKNQAPLFELFDTNYNSLKDSGLYPNSNFQGSKLFSYKVDDSGSRVADSELGLSLIHDNKGQILFENFLSTQVFQYSVAGRFYDIQGFYFHRTDNTVDNPKYSNDWFKAPNKTRQFMVDRYISDGRTRMFNISQEPEELIVTRGRVTEGNSFESLQLAEDVDFIRVNKQIMMLDIRKGDVIEIKTYSPLNPPVEATGHYEIPSNLQANPDNLEVSALSKGDFYEHFSEIMRNQEGFQGTQYSSNNYRDTLKSPNLGKQIIQHSSGLLKTMLLASNQQLDITSAIRFAESEYMRFKDKFQKKIISYIATNRFKSTDSYDVWINTALEEINKGKTKQFPFYLSGMAKTDLYNLPTFIPATPSFLGVYPLYSPEMLSEELTDIDDNTVTIWYVRGHDGSITPTDSEVIAAVLLTLENRILNSIPDTIAQRERPVCDFLESYGDQYRVNEYDYSEFLTIMRPAFERWVISRSLDYQTNNEYNENDPWTWNWSSIPAVDGSLVPGHWRGIYQKFFGTQRPDLTPWESLGFTIKPDWWDDRYGPAPYTSDNMVLWSDLANGYIHSGPRQGTNTGLARPGLLDHIPVDIQGRLRHPGPRDLIALNQPGTDLTFLPQNQPESFYEDWEDTNYNGVLGCGICQYVPLKQSRYSDWDFGDMGSIEQEWMRSSSYAFAIATASYLMKPANFVDLGWNTQDIDLLFKGTINEQWINLDTQSRARHAELSVHGESLEDSSLVTKVGIQQWVSDVLSSRSTDINANFADKVRGLGTQLSYKVAGFTDASTLVPVSDAFGRVPSEDFSVSLYQSPSIREETYSGVAFEKVENGYEIQGYNVMDPFFNIIPGSKTGRRLNVGNASKALSIPSWKPNTYYQVNITIRLDDNFYRATKTHTSSVYFETAYWTPVARPQYADGTALAWYLEPELNSTIQSIPYGTVLKTPQDVADFLNGYERYLKARGWEFSEVNPDDGSVKDWKYSLENFITWSSADVREIGDFLALSPMSNLVRFTSDHGTVQPIEQLVNGIYSIINEEGQPIDPKTTRVVRSNGDVTVFCDSQATGIFGLRLYVSEVEHIIVFKNQTIFGDTIFNPLLNIKQPRLRLQGFRTVAWKGRVDAPGFIVTGDTLTPNFERAADDFRRFFDSESMENKKLQDRARANLGYEEKEYLNNLLLTSTNQFEFYQGMIQQKGSSTAMRRLLRSNFIRHNKGLKLFEEWAFRVGDYGGQEVNQSLDVQIKQSEFTHNPQLVEFVTISDTDAELPNSLNVITIKDVKDTNSEEIIEFDPHWNWRPDTSSITWPTRDYVSSPTIADTAGFVNLDEVNYTVTNSDEFLELHGNIWDSGKLISNGERVWVYGLDQTINDWSTHRFTDLNIDVTDTVLPTFKDQGMIVSVNVNISDYWDLIDGSVIIRNNSVENNDLRSTFVPKKSSTSTLVVEGSSVNTIMSFVPQAGQKISKISIKVLESFDEGSVLTLGNTIDPELFIGVKEESPRLIDSDSFVDETVIVETPAVTYVPDASNTAPIKLVRLGNINDYGPQSVLTWNWSVGGNSLASGSINLPRPGDYVSSINNLDVYEQTVRVPLTGSTTVGTMTVSLNGNQTDSQIIQVTKASLVGQKFVDLTQVGTYEFDSNLYPAFYPWNTSLALGVNDMLLELNKASSLGKIEVSVEYTYDQGFELFELVNESLNPSVIQENLNSGDIFTWIPTKYETLSDPLLIKAKTLNLWKNGDIVEINNYGNWETYKWVGSDFVLIRKKNRKINSSLLTNGNIFDSAENRLKLVLQLYDPLKGFIPGIADREIDFKLKVDPAEYSSRFIWGKTQVGKLWWDLSKVRYLDYEIYDNLTSGVNYRWKNWGRIAPGTSVDIMEWTRSPVDPSQWNDYVLSKANLKIDNKPSGYADINTPFITEVEWNESTLVEETVYYFWVKNPTVTPSVESRRLSAQQVSNIISNPNANDIPYFAVVDVNKVIVGGIRQFLNDSDTVLKIKWTKDTEITSNHHKQWMILREADERNTINDSLWNKMRDSLVGWDSTNQLVPDTRLPKAQQNGSLIRPRQSWFPVDEAIEGGYRPNRLARESFIETLNDILSANPFVDQWTNWQNIFNSGEDLPTNYVLKALDLEDLNGLLPQSLNMVQLGEKVLIENTEQVAGFWTLWELVEIEDQRTFILSDFQKWRLQEGELWDYADWYADGWSVKNFPNYRFSTKADRDAKGNLDVTLLKGTLVQIDNIDTDSRWTWDVYTSTSKYQVAKAKSTIKMSDAFYDGSRTQLGPKQVESILGTSHSLRITPSRIQELADLINYRDGSREIEFLLNSLKSELLDTLQKNKLFFSMVKSAFKINPIVDWAFKTSFLYLGGYSETLRQSPVAFSDQIDNVISYLEEVKPYHVKIREYVRRLSYGPDLANMRMTDFDKPVYPDGANNRILNVDNSLDQAILNSQKPWKDWFETYQKPVTDISEWSTEWNGARRIKTSIKFDRISCGTVKGWDTSPWDPTLLVYSQVNEVTQSLSSLSALYRTANTQGNPNYYRDQSVETNNARNQLVRQGIVEIGKPGTIVTVLSTGKHFIWSGQTWIEFQSVGWGWDPNMGTASRIDQAYVAEPGMVRKDDPSLIAGCDFRGTQISSQFVNDKWDVFEWDSQGFDIGLSHLVGDDFEGIDGNAPADFDDDDSNILVEGHKFSQPNSDSGRPHELVNARGLEHIVITVVRSTGEAPEGPPILPIEGGPVVPVAPTVAAPFMRTFINALGKFESTTLVQNNMTFSSWDQTNHKIVLNNVLWSEDSDGFAPLHNPMNPSTGFIKTVMLSKGYRSTSSVNMTTPGTKTFKLRDVSEVNGIPAGLTGDDVRVVVVNANNPTQRAVGTLSNSRGNETNWNGSITVTFDTDFVNLGQGKSWNIIPVDMFNQPGVVWIDQARFTYSDLTITGATTTLNNVKLAGGSLDPLDITINQPDALHENRYDTWTLSSTSKVFDGSKQRQIV